MWGCASVCMTSLNWRTPTSSPETERLTLKVTACVLHTDTVCVQHELTLSPPAVHFRCVVFHPFLDQILMGKIKGCSAEGVHGEGGALCSSLLALLALNKNKTI